MPFDGIVTAAVSAELKDMLHGGRVEKIYQPASDEILFHIRSVGKKYKLLMTVNSSNPRICLIDDSESNPANPPAFCMLLRKHLTGSRICSIEQHDSERIIEFGFDSVDEMGFSVNRLLILEIMGKHSNLILCELPSMRILDSIKRISIDVNRYRQILPGLTYIYPPTHDKVSFKGLTEEKYSRIMSEKIEGRDILSPTAKALAGAFQGISTAAAMSITEMPQWPCKTIMEIDQNIENRRFYPAVYFDEKGEALDFHVIKMQHLADCTEIRHFSSVNEVIDFYYSSKSASNRVTQKGKTLHKTVSNLLDKQYLKLQRIKEDLKEAEEADHFKLWGELITANLYQITKGMQEITVLNYYDSQNITIPLDPLRTPIQNSQKYYKKYNKAKTTIREKSKMGAETEKEIEYLESVITSIENAQEAEDIDEIRQELIDNGYIRRRKMSGKPGKIKIKPYEYFTSDGMRVLVGRNNVENDKLTLKTASSRDIWLHTKDIPGSHVILFTEGAEDEDIPETSIRQAASLAAWYSKARMSSQVPVDYVRVKYVKKPSGAKPGKVIFTNNRTVYSEPGLPPVKDSDSDNR